MRLVASLAVVWHHMRGEYPLGAAFGVPLFLVIQLGLVARGSAREPFAAFARRRAALLLVPWLRWSLVYVAFGAAADVARGLAPNARLEPGMVFYGGHPTLWFLPFAAVALLASRLVLPFIGEGARAVVGLSCAAGAASWAVQRHAPELALGLPWGAWLRVAPAVLWGLAVGRAARANARERATLLVVVSGVALGVALLLPGSGDPEFGARRFALAVPLGALGFGLRRSLPTPVQALATLTFGVYLIHPLLAKILANLWNVFAWPAALHLSVVWSASAALVLLLRRSPVRLSECWSGKPMRVPSSPATPEAEPELRRAA